MELARPVAELRGKSRSGGDRRAESGERRKLEI